MRLLHLIATNHIKLSAVVSAFALMVVGALAFSTQTHAADSYSITMSPSSTELHAAPGASTTGKFTVVNLGKDDYPFIITSAPYRVVGDTYDPQFTPITGTTDASSWIHFSDAINDTLAAGKTKDMTYTLTVPTGTAPGGYYAVIFAETNPVATDGGVIAHNRVGDIIYITVDGPVIKKGTLAAPSPDVAFLQWGTSTDIGTLIADTGGVHFLTTSTINVTSLFGNKVFTAHLERYVLPQTQRLIKTTWNNLPIAGIYKVSRSATIADKTQTLPARYVVIIRPWLLLFTLFVIAGVTIVSVVSHNNKKAKR